MARPRGVKNKRSQISSLDCLKDRALRVAQAWLNDPDDDKAREGLKTLAPYIWARKQEIFGEGGGPLKIIIDREHADL